MTKAGSDNSDVRVKTPLLVIEFVSILYEFRRFIS